MSGNDAGRRTAPQPLRIVRDEEARAPVLITGGAGFVGSNLADRLLARGESVVVFDNLSRSGVRRNLDWLRESHGAGLRVVPGDVRDAAAVRRAVAGARQVFHFAAQVAVTTSLARPLEDFEVNALGTLNMLEAVRAQPAPPSVVFTSTNKVYGGLEDVAVRRSGRRYEPVDEALRTRGIDERRPLDFHSPYGCSKGSADQYVLDYARSFGLDAVVFRMSCIYGPHQFGTEDQGWLAHFVIRALADQPITIYGDGMQVRDALYVDDLMDAFLRVEPHLPALRGRAFNIGGGPDHSTSLLEVVDAIAEIRGRPVDVELDRWRTGDQRFYVSDTSRFREATGWAPRVGVQEGVRRLCQWLGARAERPVEVEAVRELV
jgi:CDP-paratose 2-epimerase